jgi:hypothetical protein
MAFVNADALDLDDLASLLTKHLPWLETTHELWPQEAGITSVKDGIQFSQHTLAIIRKNAT